MTLPNSATQDAVWPPLSQPQSPLHLGASPGKTLGGQLSSRRNPSSAVWENTWGGGSSPPGENPPAFKWICSFGCWSLDGSRDLASETFPTQYRVVLSSFTVTAASVCAHSLAELSSLTPLPSTSFTFSPSAPLYSHMSGLSIEEWPWHSCAAATFLPLN